MLPELNFLQVLRRTKFPFFVLDSDEIRYEDGLVLLNEKVVDDRNQKGSTLGQRRLQTPHTLYPLKKCIPGFVELIDCKKRHFIDNRGAYFSYNKTKIVFVKSYRITKKISKGTFTVIFCQDVNFFFATPRYPHSSEWAQIIELDGLPWKLYSTSDNYMEKYKRKI